MPGLEHYLVMSGVVFCIGLYGALAKRNIITVLMSVELMFTGVTIAAVAMSRYVTPAAILANPNEGGIVLTSVLTGQAFALFIITVAAAEIAVGLAIVIAAYRTRQSVDVTEMNQMQH